MDFIAELKDLREALTTVKPAVASRSALAVLGGVRITAYPGSVELVATDLDLTIRTTINAVVAASGTVVIDHRLLVDAAKGKGQIKIAEDGPDMVEISNGITHRVHTLPVTEFPKLAEVVNGGWSRRLPLAPLGQVATAASKEQTRPILTGVLFAGDRVVATDSYRLHYDELGTERLADPILIPSSTVTAVVKALKKATDVVLHHVPGGQEATFRSGATTWTTRLIEGQFPNYHQLVPANPPYTATVDKDAFVAALAPLNVIARKLSDTVPVRLIFTADELTMQLIWQDVGTREVKVPCKWDGPDAPDPDDKGWTPAFASFNPAYLLDAITNLSGSLTDMHFTDHLKPVNVSDGSGAVRLLMPVRVP